MSPCLFLFGLVFPDEFSDSFFFYTGASSILRPKQPLPSYLINATKALFNNRETKESTLHFKSSTISLPHDNPCILQAILLYSRLNITIKFSHKTVPGSLSIPGTPLRTESMGSTCSDHLT